MVWITNDPALRQFPRRLPVNPEILLTTQQNSRQPDPPPHKTLTA